MLHSASLCLALLRCALLCLAVLRSAFLCFAFPCSAFLRFGLPRSAVTSCCIASYRVSSRCVLTFQVRCRGERLPLLTAARVQGVHRREYPAERLLRWHPGREAAGQDHAVRRPEDSGHQHQGGEPDDLQAGKRASMPSSTSPLPPGHVHVGLVVKLC